MCLIIFSYKTHPQHDLLLMANRDEFFDRPTESAHWWTDHPEILGGRDLKGMGTWMAVNKKGNFAALTNYRDLAHMRKDAPSRGNLVNNFLTSSLSPEEYLAKVNIRAEEYNGFNLLVGDNDSLWHYSNISRKAQELKPGIYGLSNHLLDTPWPKVVKGKQKMASLKEPNMANMLEMMKDLQIAPDEDLPHTGVPTVWERALSAMYIKMENYGTRCSTILIKEVSGQIHFQEKSYVPEGELKQFTFQAK